MGLAGTDLDEWRSLLIIDAERGVYGGEEAYLLE